mmetsp:Transcript_9596/g.18818  ORF Transcript_9596/g.18818 Transcript_9596/m.18818 type:complete len:429 (+) Transcript_9596:320-1606(+)|eukprot:CAMPEP_0167781792 /NCGR_PEP_ID=MMETSP0111_2-20121227/6135_1 /TAXON_ID=91324 /ORGANISM="Lotharella globosa, Strain CCCM811" /LENGTH=428 /DNA_ID=CAMNT_0007672505 /DNA_START=183 /DNA_END=1469 /DNA_ORIENTATION=+
MPLHHPLHPLHPRRRFFTAPVIACLFFIAAMVWMGNSVAEGPLGMATERLHIRTVQGVLPGMRRSVEVRATMESAPKVDIPDISKAFKGTFEKEPAEYPRFRSLIGETPIIDLTMMANPKVEGVRVLAKCEFMNPGYSIKDRIAEHIIDEAEREGLLKPGMTIVAASSGNTGAATAMVAAMKGYKAIIITSPKCSREKMDAIRAYGAKLIVTAGGLKPCDPEHYMNMEKTLCDGNPDYFGVNQYDNILNPLAHYETLGPEIWSQTQGRVTHFVAAGSTGGTLSGTARYLKERSGGKVKVVMADPIGSIFYEYFKNGQLCDPEPFEVEGVGKDDIPGAMDFNLIDDAVRVSDAEAFKMCHDMARQEGVLAGGSGGLNVYAATQLANKATKPCTIVTVLPDSGIKYMSKIYNGDWLQKCVGMELPGDDSE